MANLPIAEFLEERLNEWDPDFEVREGTGFEQLFFKPIQFIVQPFRDEANDIQVSQSFLRILQTDDPDAFDEEPVDALAANLFVERVSGDVSSGTGRALYDRPVTREYPAEGATFVGNNGQNYINPDPFSISEAAMSSQIEDGLYYFDIQLQSENTGEDTELEADGLVQLVNDPDVVNVTNPAAFVGGQDRESNTELIERTKDSIAVRDLVTGKGFNAIMFETFPGQIDSLNPIGFGDNEMMRDIVFNTHIGGRVDGYVKTPRIDEGAKNFVGLLVDETRQTETLTNIEMDGTDWISMGQPNIDRSNGLVPTVKQTKAEVRAEYTSTVDMGEGVDLSTRQHVGLVIDGVDRSVRVAGVNPGETQRNEIVELINAAFGFDVCEPTGNTIIVFSLQPGRDSQVTIQDPSIGQSAIDLVFGLAVGGVYDFFGDGPLEFIEDEHYDIDDKPANIRRLIGDQIVAPTNTGQTTANSTTFSDATANIFLNVDENDIITINSGDDAGDYRVLEKTDNQNLVVDDTFQNDAVGLEYTIRRTGIKDGELVETNYWFNPLSIDIGPQVKLDEVGRERGIREGREDQTITDIAYIRTTKIEQIDPVTEEPTGVEYQESRGFGYGGYGLGPFGVGEGTDYYMVVNEPHDRFSTFEDSYIVLDSSLEGLSFRVSYDYVPDMESFHNFVRSEEERVLDGDILMKHFLPCYVTGEIEYSADDSDQDIPDNDTLNEDVNQFITNRGFNNDVTYSEIVQYITQQTDPHSSYSTYVRNFTLKGTIHLQDGTVFVVTGEDRLEIPDIEPFPKETDTPFSKRNVHWIGEVTLTRLKQDSTDASTSEGSTTTDGSETTAGNVRSTSISSQSTITANLFRRGN